MSVTDVTEHLIAEFEGKFTLPAIVDVVRGCQQDLKGASPGALPELLERLARQRLYTLDTSGQPGDQRRPGL